MTKKTEAAEEHFHRYKVTTLENAVDVYEARRCATCGTSKVALRFKKFLSRFRRK